jgi:hypothetical protein
VHLISDKSAALSESQPIATGLVKNWKEKANPVKTAAASSDATVLGGLNDEDAFATKPKFKVTAKVSKVPKFNPSMARDMSRKNDVGTNIILSLY